MRTQDNIRQVLGCLYRDTHAYAHIQSMLNIHSTCALLYLSTYIGKTVIGSICSLASFGAAFMANQRLILSVERSE